MLPCEPQYRNWVSGMTARVNRGLSGSGFHWPMPTCAGATAADAVPAFSGPMAAAPAPTSPAVRRNDRRPGPFNVCDPINVCDGGFSPP